MEQRWYSSRCACGAMSASAVRRPALMRTSNNALSVPRNNISPVSRAPRHAASMPYCWTICRDATCNGSRMRSMLERTSKNLHFIPTDGTTDMTTSHLTNPAKDAGQVIGYSHSTKLPKNGNQVAGYAALLKKFLAYI